jgi:Na+/H+-translocating membrane pyrophosphatase
LLVGLPVALGATIHLTGKDIAVYDHPSWVPAHLVVGVFAVLMQLGLFGLYGRQVERMGWLGLVGFGLGYVLFGIATMRAGVLPRWSGLLLRIRVVLFMFAEVTRETALLSGTLPYAIGTAGQGVVALSLMWMGYALFLEKREPVR